MVCLHKLLHKLQLAVHTALQRELHSEHMYIVNAFYLYLGQYEYFETFGAPTIFYKLWEKIDRARLLDCPRCGNKGVLMHKSTVSKRKYSYRKLYVYHENQHVTHRSTVRFQKWCYLNRNQLEDPIIQDTLKSVKRARDVERFFYLCLRVPIEMYEARV